MDQISEMLSYRPRIKETKPKIAEHYTDYTRTEYNSSKCLNTLKDNKLSITLNNVRSDIKSITELATRIESDITSKYGNGFKNNLDDYISNNNGVDGDLIFETCKIVNENLNILKDVCEIYKDSLFGEDDAYVQENILLTQLAELESGSYEDRDKINYTIISLDSLLSSALVSFSSNLTTLTYEFYNVLESYEDIEIIQNPTEQLSRIFKSKFEEINTEYNSKRNLCFDDVFDNIKNNLLCVFEQRDLIEDVQKAYKDIDKNNLSNYVTMIMESLDVEINKGFDIIEDFIKNTLLFIIYREDFLKIFTEKQTISNYYNQTARR